MSNVPSGEIVFIDEVLRSKDYREGDSVRILGRCVQIVYISYGCGL